MQGSVFFKAQDNKAFENIKLGPIENSVNDPNRVDLDQSFKIPFHIVAEGLLEHTDILFIGDGLHFNEKIRNTVFSAITIDTFVRSGVEKFLVESPKGINAENIRKELDKWYYAYPAHFHRAEKLRGLLNVEDKGIEVLGIDPQTSDEKAEMGGYDTIRKKTVFLHDRILTDPELAENIAEQSSSDYKTVVFYGAAHGSRFSDGIPEIFTAQGLRCIKIEIAPSIALHKDVEQIAHRLNARIDFALPDNDVSIGEEQADLVYFAEEGTLHFTDNTPPEIREIVVELFSRTNSFELASPEPR